VELIKERHPTSKILLLRPFPKGLDTQRHEATSPPVFSFSQSDVEAARQAGELISRLADDKQVFWLDVNHVFLRPDGTINVDVMWDLLHPNAAGAEAWAQAIEPTLARTDGRPTHRGSTNQFRGRAGFKNWRTIATIGFARHAEVLRIKNTINPRLFSSAIPSHISGVANRKPTTSTVRSRGICFWQIPDIESRLWLGSHAKRPLATRPRRTRQPASSHHRPPHWHEQHQRHRQRPAEHARRIAEGIRQVIIRIRSKVPAAKIILMAVFPRDQKPDAPRRAQIAGINKLIAEFGKTPVSASST